MTLYLEYSSSTYHTAAFVKADLISKFTGFRSVYMYDESILNKKDMKNLDDFQVYSDTLFIDIDDYTSHLEVVKYFKNNTYKLYNSGGKGMHLHIPLDKIYQGKTLPQQQKKFIQSITDKADLSIYKHSGLFRLENTIHQRTKQRKRLVSENEGDLLILPNIDIQQKYKQIIENITITEWLFLDIINLINNTPEQGNRHMSLFKLVKKLQEAGFSEYYAYETITKINDNWDNPKDDEDICRLIKDIYNN